MDQPRSAAEAVRHPLVQSAFAQLAAGCGDVLNAMLASGGIAVGGVESEALEAETLLQEGWTHALAFGLQIQGVPAISGAVLLEGGMLPALAGALMGEPETPTAIEELHLPALRDTLLNVVGRWAQSLGEEYGGRPEARLDDDVDPRDAAALVRTHLRGSLVRAVVPLSLAGQAGTLQVALTLESANSIIATHPAEREVVQMDEQPKGQPPESQSLSSMIGHNAPGQSPPTEAQVNISRPVFQQLSPRGNGDHSGRGLDLILDVPLTISVELGRKGLNIKDILDLVPGSLIELDKLAGEPLDLLINGKLFAKGEVVVIDENFGIRVTTIVSPEERIQQLR